MSKYIIFKAEDASAEQWEKMLLAHTGACTDILAEHYDSSKKSIPQPGYRLRDFCTVEKFIDPQFPGSSTHSCVGDWEVTKVDEYISNLPTGGFESVIICYCQYSPITSPLEPLHRIQSAQELQHV
jgi:hypothetical protein